MANEYDHERLWLEIKRDLYKLLSRGESIVVKTGLDYHIHKEKTTFGYLITREYEEWIGGQVVVVRRLSKNSHSPVCLSLVCKTQEDIFVCLDVIRDKMPTILFCKHVAFCGQISDGIEIYERLVEMREV